MKKRTVLTWLWHRMKKRVPALAAMVLVSVATSAFGVLFALESRNVINSAVSGSTDRLVQAVIWLTVWILGLLICPTVHRYLHYRLASVLDRDWKRSLTEKILRGEYAKVSEFHSGELMNRLSNDVRVVDEGVLSLLPSLASMVTRIAAVLAALGAMVPVFAGILVAAGLLVMGITAAARQYLKKLNKEVSACEGRVSGFLHEIFEKLLMVQGLHVEEEVLCRTDDHLDARYRLHQKRNGVNVAASAGLSILGYASGFGALIWGAFGIARGAMTFGDLTAVTQLVSQLQGPMINISGIFPRYAALTAAAERLMELEDACCVEKREETVADYSQMDAICAQDLCFGYEQERVLEKGNFSLPKGSFTVVTGKTGIGKSTLLKLLLGIFQPTGGKLYFACNGAEISVSRSSRELFAYVPQGNLLLSGTVRENLLLTRPQATQEELEQAIWVSCMDEFLPQLPKGLDTSLRENAQGLSEGQAQRLSIARAVLSGAPILLLDEATSALDEKTEAEVLRRLRRLPGKTCIAVTHRSAAVALADRRLEVENGVIHSAPIE